MSVCAVLDIVLKWREYHNDEKCWFWKIRDWILRAFSTIYIYHPTGDDGSEDLRMHISIDVVMFIQLVIFTGIIGAKTSSNSTLLGIVFQGIEL